MPNSQDRLNKIRAALNSDIYSKIEEIEVESQTTGDESTTRLANILDGYNTRITNNKDLDESNDELQLLDQMEVEIEVNEEEILKAYNDNIHNSLTNKDETLSELAEQLSGTKSEVNNTTIADLDIFDVVTQEDIEESEVNETDNLISEEQVSNDIIVNEEVENEAEDEVDDKMLIIQQEIEKLESMLMNNDEEPEVEEPEVEEPAIEETAVEETAVEEPAVEETAVEETAVEETAVEETAVEEPEVKETPVEEPEVKETPVEEPEVEETEKMMLLQAEIQKLEKQLQNNKVVEESTSNNLSKDVESEDVVMEDIKEDVKSDVVNESSVKTEQKNKSDNKSSKPKKTKGSGNLVNILLIIIIIILLIAAGYYAYIGGYFQMIMELFR